MSQVSRCQSNHSTCDRVAPQAASMSLSYTLPLNDGALGTIPLTHQRSALALLKADAPRLAAAVRPLLSAFVATTARCIHNLGWLEAGRRLALYIAVSALELQLLVCAPILFLALPGVISLPCVGFGAALVWHLVQRLNRRNNTQQQQEVFTYANAEGEGATAAKNSTAERWHWIVVGGADLDPEATREGTLPRLAALFASDMHAFIPCSLGLPLDIAVALLRTTTTSPLASAGVLPTARSAALYRAVRAQLLRSRKKNPAVAGVRVLAHGTGAADVAWVLARLCADLPAGEGLLGRLQVFTFGAAVAEMTVPLGGQQQSDGHGGGGPGGLYPTVTHFAFEDDPFAQMGVLLGIRRRLEGRFVGDLYTIRNNSNNASDPSQYQSRFLPRVPSYTLDDYLDALFPGGDPRAGVLGRVCRIDREVSEMRELAALAQSVDNSHHHHHPNKKTTRADGTAKRLSWTVLGAVADSLSSSSSSSSNGERDQGGGMDMDMAGAFSLYEARRRGKALEGMRGYENNALAEAAMSSFRWKRTGTGMGGGEDEGEGEGESEDPSAINTYIPPAIH
ncbi:hypothetical protein F4775DRAFT_589698 [Biscogniauxia sp. FL1348]|nr:hypothetical protein F4775DRAFT_589698 [Biscogniauxia sp. FL1348]